MFASAVAVSLGVATAVVVASGDEHFDCAMEHFAAAVAADELVTVVVAEVVGLSFVGAAIFAEAVLSVVSVTVAAIAPAAVAMRELASVAEDAGDGDDCVLTPVVH